LDLPKAISDLDSTPFLFAWGKVIAGAVAFTFGADSLSLGGLGGLGGLGALRVDKPIAAAKIEFIGLNACVAKAKDQEGSPNKRQRADFIAAGRGE